MIEFKELLKRFNRVCMKQGKWLRLTVSKYPLYFDCFEPASIVLNRESIIQKIWKKLQNAGGEIGAMNIVPQEEKDFLLEQKVSSGRRILMFLLPKANDNSSEETS